MALFTPFSMPTLNKNPMGGYEPQGHSIQWQDNATKLMGNPEAYQGQLGRDLARFNNGVQLEHMNKGFNGLGTALADGFNGMADAGQYGGIYGNSQNRNYSPQSGNWGAGGFNPFSIGSGRMGSF